MIDGKIIIDFSNDTPKQNVHPPVAILVTEDENNSHEYHFKNIDINSSNATNNIFKCQSMLNIKTSSKPPFDLELQKLHSANTPKSCLATSQIFKEYKKQSNASTQNLNDDISYQYFVYSSHRLNRKCLSRVNLGVLSPNDLSCSHNKNSDRTERFSEMNQDINKQNKRSVNFLRSGYLFS